MKRILTKTPLNYFEINLTAWKKTRQLVPLNIMNAKVFLISVGYFFTQKLVNMIVMNMIVMIFGDSE